MTHSKATLAGLMFGDALRRGVELAWAFTRGVYSTTFGGSRLPRP